MDFGIFNLMGARQADKPTARARPSPRTCASPSRSATPHAAAMRSMELMIGEVKPRAERARGPVDHIAAE